VIRSLVDDRRLANNSFSCSNGRIFLVFYVIWFLRRCNRFFLPKNNDVAEPENVGAVDQLNPEPVPTSKIKKPVVRVREKKKKLVQCLDCNSDCPKFPLEDIEEHYRSTHPYIKQIPGNIFF
jgi:hypothetical protein